MIILYINMLLLPFYLKKVKLGLRIIIILVRSTISFSQYVQNKAPGIWSTKDPIPITKVQ